MPLSPIGMQVSNPVSVLFVIALVLLTIKIGGRRMLRYRVRDIHGEAVVTSLEEDK